MDALKDELPVTIHRPAVVCGDSRTGETAKYDGVYYLINYLRMWPGALSLANIGNAEVRLNVVPVDFVVEAMSALARDERAVGATVQLADPASLVHTSLRLPLSEKVSRLPRIGVPYFFLKQTYDTALARELLDPHGIRCPRFPDYVPALLDFVERHPKL